jgi:hypothetical protein
MEMLGIEWLDLNNGLSSCAGIQRSAVPGKSIKTAAMKQNFGVKDIPFSCIPNSTS